MFATKHSENWYLIELKEDYISKYNLRNYMKHGTAIVWDTGKVFLTANVIDTIPKDIANILYRIKFEEVEDVGE